MHAMHVRMHRAQDVLGAVGTVHGMRNALGAVGTVRGMRWELWALCVAGAGLPTAAGPAHAARRESKRWRSRSAPACISAVSRLYLPCISGASRLYLACSSGASRLYLPYSSAADDG